jgi:hypothetical protein
VNAPEKTPTNCGFAFAKNATGALDLSEGRILMRRISHSFVVLAATAVMGLIAAALPLAAMATNGGPGA